MTKPIEIAVVGHTNVGKTSLLRTLTRKVGFGEISDSPGTTRNPQSSDYRIDGVSLLKYWDTPGLEDSVSLHHYLQQFQHQDADAPDWIHAFLKGPEAVATFEQEAKVLRKILDVDAVIYVIDCRSDVLPKYKCEIQTICACAKPVLPVLNFVRSPDNQTDKWRKLLAASGLHALVPFDAVAPFVGSEKQLYDYLGIVLEQHKAQFQRVIQDIEHQTQERRVASCTLAADVLVSVAAMRREIDKASLANESKKAAFIQDFKSDLGRSVRNCVVSVLEVHAFRKDDANVEIPPWESGRWDSDVLNPDLLLHAGKRMGKGVAVGAAVGFAVDLALAGLSLGAASAIGATIGGLASQGWGQVPHKLLNLYNGVEELTLEMDAIERLAENLVSLLKVLELRSHADLGKVDTFPELTIEVKDRIKTLVQSLASARSDPEWERRPGHKRINNTDRTNLVDQVQSQLLDLLKL